MSGRNEQEYLFQEAARRELRPRPHRQARVPDSQPGHRSWLGRRWSRREIGHRTGLRGGSAADPNLLSVDSGPASRHSSGERQVPGNQLSDRPGRRLRHRALRRRGQEQAKAPGTSMSARRRSSKCRPFIKAGVIEPWDNYIPKEVIDDIIPSIREECTIDGKLYSWPFLLDVIGSGMAFGHHRARPACRMPRPRPGTTSWPSCQEDRRFQGRAVGRHVRLRTAGVRWRRSRTA